MRVNRLQELISLVLEKTGAVSQLKLAKLIYLIEWRYYSKHGTQLTNAWYLRERRGPVPATFGKELEKMRGFEIEMTPRGLVAPGQRPRFQPRFEDSDLKSIVETLRRYQHRSERDLLLATYLTPPMKSILREEKGGAERKHHGVVFGRFPREVEAAIAAEEVASSAIRHVAPEDMTDEDMRNVIQAFAESELLMRTAENLVAPDDSETA